MAIKPRCDKCGKELKKFGAILLGPPNRKSEVKKFHICPSCYGVVLKFMRKARSRGR